MYEDIFSIINSISLTSGRCGCNLELIILKPISGVDILNIFCEIALKWMPEDPTDD